MIKNFDRIGPIHICLNATELFGTIADSLLYREIKKKLE